MRQDRAWQNGWKAARDGKPSSANPHVPFYQVVSCKGKRFWRDNQANRDWDLGWHGYHKGEPL